MKHVNACLTERVFYVWGGISIQILNSNNTMKKRLHTCKSPGFYGSKSKQVLAVTFTPLPQMLTVTLPQNWR